MRVATIFCLLHALVAASPAFADGPATSYEIARAVDTGPVTAGASGVAVSFPVEVGGAPWMQLVFGRVDLPDGALLRVVSPRDGRVHQVDAIALAQWGGRSAYMNGDALVVEVLAAPGTSAIRVVLERVVVGLPAPQLTVCGTGDDRLPSDDRRVARIHPSGCTGFVIDACKHGLLTAGHCVLPGAFQAALFRVPPSLPDGTPQMPAPEDQYPIDLLSLQSEFVGIGQDWAYFGCFANAITGLTPHQREGVAFPLQVVNAFDPAAVLRVAGYGADTQLVRNRVQQSATGAWTGLNGDVVDHLVDTDSGSSGSPVSFASGEAAIAIHTNGGCNGAGVSNAGTWIGYAGLQAALANPGGVLRCVGSWSTYCSAKVNSQGCTPVLAASAAPSFSGGPGSCVVTATNVLNNKPGIFFYGFATAAIPFQGGTLCVGAPVTRTPIQTAGGNPPPSDCSGTYTYDLGARIASGADPRLVAGATVMGQFWSRDPLSPSYPTGLTGGIRLEIGL